MEREEGGRREEVERRGEFVMVGTGTPGVCATWSRLSPPKLIDLSLRPGGLYLISYILIQGRHYMDFTYFKMPPPFWP